MRHNMEYQCVFCRARFTRPEHWHDPGDWGYWGGSEPETIEYCPNCGSEDIEEVKKEDE